MDFNIYPNPTTGITSFSFQVESVESMVLNIINLDGKLVFQKDLGVLQHGENVVQLDLSGLKNGVYSGILKNSGSITVTRKFLIAN